jgi:hypothetical protein
MKQLITKKLKQLKTKNKKKKKQEEEEARGGSKWFLGWPKPSHRPWGWLSHPHLALEVVLAIPIAGLRVVEPDPLGPRG